MGSEGDNKFVRAWNKSHEEVLKAFSMFSLEKRIGSLSLDMKSCHKKGEEDWP